MTVKAPPKLEEPEEILKKRIAHPAAESNIIKSVGPSEPPKRLPSAQDRMYERWRLMKQVAAEKAAEKATESKTPRSVFQKSFLGNTATNTNDHQLNGNGIKFTNLIKQNNIYFKLSAAVKIIIGNNIN